MKLTKTDFDECAQYMEIFDSVSTSSVGPVFRVEVYMPMFGVVTISWILRDSHYALILHGRQICAGYVNYFNNREQLATAVWHDFLSQAKVKWVQDN